MGNEVRAMYFCDAQSVVRVRYSIKLLRFDRGTAALAEVEDLQDQHRLLERDRQDVADADRAAGRIDPPPVEADMSGLRKFGREAARLDHPRAPDPDVYAGGRREG